MMEKMELLGAKKSTVDPLIPTGKIVQPRRYLDPPNHCGGVLIGYGVATLVVAKWTGDLDTEQPTRRLNDPGWQDVREPEVLLNPQDSAHGHLGGQIVLHTPWQRHS